jgi:glycosyltransferase
VADLTFSILTPTFNAARTLGDCLRSVREQDYPNVEHLIVDGASNDGTLDVVRAAQRNFPQANLRLFSEPDRGLYDALNKGIARADGDVIGVLGADDAYADARVLSRVADALAGGCPAAYGDLLYVSAADTSRIIRYWRAAPCRARSFDRGWMPPHPTLFVRRDVCRRLGGYRTDFRIAADYEFMLRLMHRHRLRAAYVPEVLVRMRVGGMSNRSLGNLVRKSWEDLKAWQVNGTGHRPLTVLMKNLRKLPQLVQRPG